MSEQSAFDELITRTATNAGRQRDREITNGARLAENVEARIVGRIGRTGSLEWQLADEIAALSERMEWLADHPRLSRFVGKSAVTLSLEKGERAGVSGEQVRTPIILEVDKTVAESHILTAGYVFWKFHHAPPKLNGLYIDRAVRDATTGHEERSLAYQLYRYQTEVGPRVDVSGGDFDDFRIARTRELIDKFADGRSWMHAFEIDDGEWHAGGWHRSVWCDEKRLEDDIKSPELKIVAPLLEDGYRKEIHEQLLPQLKLGTGWQYLDGMYAEPLDLVRAAHDAIGRRK
jgi:hypothetical protein